MAYQIINGNNIDVLKTFPDNHFDSIVCDPPYGISFLGKDWDAHTGEVNLYKECLRVLKPGGHILAFSAARTYHKLATSIEEAGFEIRDQIMWIYSSGFPKSQDVGKSIQRSLGVKETKSQSGTNAFINTGNSTKYPNEHNMVKNETTVCTDNEAKQWAGWGTALKPAQESIVMARKSLGVKSGAISNSIEDITSLLETIWLIANNAEKNSNKQKTTEFIAVENVLETTKQKGLQDKHQLDGQLKSMSPYLVEDSTYLNTAMLWNSILAENLPAANMCTIKMETNITTVLTTLKSSLLAIIQESITKDRSNLKEEMLVAQYVEQQLLNSLLNCKDTLQELIAHERATAPAGNLHEPIVMARKPVKQSIAKNVQEWGTGALNIDACRVGDFVATAPSTGTNVIDRVLRGKDDANATEGIPTAIGRFPSNVLGDITDYQKYFYCPKVSRKERHVGGLADNNHPTVKPVALMSYLIKLVTPPNGKVLDPFNGSGSTGIAAVELGHDYTGIELDPNYCEIARKRIEAWNKPTPTNNNYDQLFETKTPKE